MEAFWAFCSYNKKKKKGLISNTNTLKLVWKKKEGKISTLEKNSERLLIAAIQIYVNIKPLLIMLQLLTLPKVILPNSLSSAFTSVIRAKIWKRNVSTVDFPYPELYYLKMPTKNIWGQMFGPAVEIPTFPRRVPGFKC